MRQPLSALQEREGPATPSRARGRERFVLIAREDVAAALADAERIVATIADRLRRGGLLE